VVELKDLNRARVKLINKFMSDMNHKDTTQEQKEVYDYIIEEIEEEFSDEFGDFE
jgi:hypothetical protein